MADWYVSSVAWAAVPVWQANHAYAVGDFVRPTAPTAPHLHVHRCTTAGTSGATEPGWANWTTGGGSTTSGTAVFNNVAGQAAYGWSAPLGTYITTTYQYTNGFPPGDRVFMSSDHVETISPSYIAAGYEQTGLFQVISVNRAGSVPPVAADVQAGATVTVPSGGISFTGMPCYWDGVTFNANNFSFNNGGNRGYYFKNCAFVVNTASTGSKFNDNNPTARLTFDNTTIQFGNAGQYMFSANYSLDFTWLNTLAALKGAIFPTLLLSSGGSPTAITCRGVDLSAMASGTLVNATGYGAMKALLDSCRIAPGVTRANFTSSGSSGDDCELVNCFDGTNLISERYKQSGSLVMDRTTVMTGGAADDVGSFSFKLTSNAGVDRFVVPVDTFFFDVENTAVGTAKTATVEIISSTTLNNNDIRLVVNYLGTAGSMLTSVVDSSVTPLTTSALPTSTAIWSSPPATPVKQYLRVTFTPQVAGRVRGQVMLGKPSTTVWVNPQLSIA